MMSLETVLEEIYNQGRFNAGIVTPQFIDPLIEHLTYEQQNAIMMVARSAAMAKGDEKDEWTDLAEAVGEGA